MIDIKSESNDDINTSIFVYINNNNCLQGMSNGRTIHYWFILKEFVNLLVRNLTLGMLAGYSYSPKIEAFRVTHLF